MKAERCKCHIIPRAVRLWHDANKFLIKLLNRFESLTCRLEAKRIYTPLSESILRPILAFEISQKFMYAGRQLIPRTLCNKMQQIL